MKLKFTHILNILFIVMFILLLAGIGFAHWNWSPSPFGASFFGIDFFITQPSSFIGLVACGALVFFNLALLVLAFFVWIGTIKALIFIIKLAYPSK